MITFGLTGGIACGKSTATKTFRKHNIPIVDADIVARQVVEKGMPGWQSIVDAFGPQFLLEDETLNRTLLGHHVFSNAQAMSRLNSIMAPLIEQEAGVQIKEQHSQGNVLVGYDAALICEMGNADKYRPLIVVSCPQVTQIDRLMTRNFLTREQAMARISAQMPLENKIKLADFVIDTSGAIEDSIKQTENVISKLSTLIDMG